MSGNYENGFDAMPTGANYATIAAFLAEETFYYPTSVLGNANCTLTPGVYGYGQRLEFNFVSGALSGVPNFYAIRPIGSHNSAGGWISVGLRVNSGGVPLGFPLVSVWDAVNNIPQATVCFETNGVVRAYRSGGPTFGNILLGQSEAGQFDLDVDFDVEVFFKVDSAVGEIEVRIDTISVLHLTNMNTQAGANAYFDSIGFGWTRPPSGGAFITMTFDNLRYYDKQGTINNTWLGTARIQELIAAANGTTTDFTRSNTGLANWQNIINLNRDDGLYLFDPTVGDFNLSTPTPLINSPTVFWVGFAGIYRQDDATQRFVKNRIVSAGHTQDGASFPTTQTYSCDHDVFETDPATGIQFTGAAVNALNFGPLVYA